MSIQAEHATKLVVRGAAVICPQSPAYRRGSAAAAAMTFDGEKLAALIQQVGPRQTTGSVLNIIVQLVELANFLEPK